MPIGSELISRLVSELKLSNTLAEDLRVYFANLDIAQSYLAPGSSRVMSLDELSNDLGLVEAGEFRSGNSNLPGGGFTGVRIGYPGFTYNGQTWNIVGVNNDVMQVGIRASDGKLLAGEGDVVVDSSGISIIASNENLLKWTSSGATIGVIYSDVVADVTGMAIIGQAKNSSYEPYLVLAIRDENLNTVINFELEGGVNDGPIRIQSYLKDEDGTEHQGRISPRMVHSPGYNLDLAWLWGMWPLNGNANDIVPNSGLHLTENGGITKYSHEEVAYYDFDGTNDYLSRSDESRLDLTGNCAFFGWAYFDNATGSTEVLLSKWRTDTNNRTFLVERHTNGNLRFRVSSDGSSTTTVALIGPSQGKWFFWYAGYVASSKLELWWGQEGSALNKAEETTSVPSSLFNSDATFALGANQNGVSSFTNLLNGRQARAGMLNGGLSERGIKRLYIQSLELFGFQ